MSGSPAYSIPTVVTVQPCASIAPEAFTGDSFFSTVADRYSALTTELPLEGGSAMKPTVTGEMMLVGYLRACAPWLAPAIDSIDRQLRIQAWAGRPWLSWRPILLAGPPGAGKSHLARLISRVSGCGSGTLDLGGTSDSRTLEGTARGWANAQPSWPALMMSQTKTGNPILVLEEVDKAGGSPQGGAAHGVLLTMLEAESSATYWDKCLLSTVNLSNICWLLTANNPRILPPMLLSRLDVIEVQGPSISDFDALLFSITAELASLWAVPIDAMPTLPAATWDALEQQFERSGSARHLRRKLEATYSDLVTTVTRNAH